jgi:putative oxidoreductase
MNKSSKAMNITLWVFSGLLAALFVIAGGAKFIGAMDDDFIRWGYTLGFAAMVGILEVVGAVGLLFKRTAGWAAVGLMVIMLGAMWTHIAHAEYIMLLLPIAVFLSLGFVAWGRGLVWRTREPELVARTTFTDEAASRT